jgi:transcriptional regulator with XRE-family HTH domain
MVRPGKPDVRSRVRDIAALLKTLKTLRLEAGLSQAQVAKALGLPQSFVSKYESGERRLDLLELRAVCVALRISLRDFVARFEENQSGSVRR